MSEVPIAPLCESNAVVTSCLDQTSHSVITFGLLHLHQARVRAMTRFSLLVSGSCIVINNVYPSGHPRQVEAVAAEQGAIKCGDQQRGTRVIRPTSPCSR